MRKAVDKTLESTLAIIMFVMVLAVLWQVFSRYVLQDPSSFTEELVRFLLIWVGILGAAYASGKRLHLAIDLLPSRLAPPQKAILQKVIDSFVLLFAVAVFIIGGGRLVYITFLLEQNSPALQLPLAFVYTVMPLSGVIIVFYKIQSLIQK